MSLLFDVKFRNITFIAGFTLFLLCGVMGCQLDLLAGPPWLLGSDNGEIQLRVEPQASQVDGKPGPLSYSIYYREQPVIENGRLGLLTDRGALMDNIQITQAYTRRIDSSYEMMVGKRLQRHEKGRELVLQAARDADSGLTMKIIFRVHHDGVAFRYVIEGSGDIVIQAENTDFPLPAVTKTWMAPYDLLGSFFSGSYEQLYQPEKLGAKSSGGGWAYPALFALPERKGWLLLSEADLNHQYCATRLQVTEDPQIYSIAFPPPQEGNDVGWVEPRAILPMQTPWRVLMLGQLKDIVESTLVTDLSAPSVIADTRWIRPGRVAWSWASQMTGDVALQRKYIQFAGLMGWEGVLIDAGWSQWDNVNMVMPALVAEAAAEDVGLVLWYNSGGEHNLEPAEPRDKMHQRDVRRQEFAKLQRWGVMGVKIDHFHSDKQDRIAQYIAILEDAADFELMVNFHGSTLPRGWQRTYPNLMTYEAVHGVEYFKTPVAGPRPIDNVRNVFTRNVVGSMDYTPLSFQAAYEQAGTTFAHDLALVVLFESGWQHFAYSADPEMEHGFLRLFEKFNFVQDFLQEVPVTWDETRFLAGDPDTFAVLARRKGSTWYVAGVQGTATVVRLDLPLDFLSPETYQMRKIHSGDEPTQMIETVSRVRTPERLMIDLAENDGFVAVIELQN